MNEGNWASIGIKRGTKEILNKVSSEIVHELERWDLTWDDIVLYLSYIYLKNKDKNFSMEIDINNYYNKDDIEKIRKKLKII